MNNFISYIDEITIVMLLPLSIIRLYKTKEFPDRLCLALLFPMIILCISGFISGIVNENPLFVTALGVFDYIKNLFVIFIYAAFFRDFRGVKKIFHILLTITVFLGVVAIFQEIGALLSKYVYGIDHSAVFNQKHWRLGFYRTNSLMYHPNMFGLYSLLIFTIYLYITKKINFMILIPICSGIITSISRMAVTGFLMIISINIFRRWRWRIVVAACLGVILFFMLSYMPDINHIITDDGSSGVITYREHTRDKALEIWKDHPFWGIGPGFFGGVISIKYHSYVYEEYNLAHEALTMLRSFRGIDQFWPQVLAEMGFIGTVAFASILTMLFITLFILRRQPSIDEMKRLLVGLAAFLIVILIYTIGSGLNITAILFTYCAFVGMGFGSSERSSYYQVNKEVK